MTDVIIDTLIDAAKLLPFLFVTYLIMEYLEKKTGDSMNNAIKKSGHLGPLLGGIFGAFPQCGFSAAAANLYAGHVITLGTLIAIFLSTSDEMLPILISEKVNAAVILKILAMKAAIGVICGFVIDLAAAFVHRQDRGMDIGKLCRREHCSCEEESGIIRPALTHTLHIFNFVIIVTFAINTAIHYVGENRLESLIITAPFAGEFIAGAVGLIPNCAASVIITQLYLEGILPLGAMMSGLLVSAGVGLLVLFRVNDAPKENIKIMFILYLSGVICGCIMELLKIQI